MEEDLVQILELLAVQETNVLANGRGRHVVAGMVELEGSESFVLDIVAERDVEPPRTSEAAGRSATAAKEFSQCVFF